MTKINTSSLQQLTALIESRKGGDASNSYVTSLLAKGTKKIAQKIGEEATEVAIAAVSETKEALVSESADLLFHLMILLADQDLSLADVLGELEKREGISGLTEKANR